MPNIKRTFGWVQNPNDLTNLKRVVGLFVKGSDINKEIVNYRYPIILKNGLMTISDAKLISEYINQDCKPIPYTVLKGKGCGQGSRSQAKCSGLAQMAIDAQKTIQILDLHDALIDIKKPYTDDWSTDGFLRWGISTGLLSYNPQDDSVSITYLGQTLVRSKSGSSAETEALTRALLSYPPVIRVLSILASDTTNEGLTKFEIGQQLGFVGELGFTSIDLGYFLALLSQAEDNTEKSNIRQNIEGDSDKYARTISSWLIQMGWVEKSKKLASGMYRGILYQEHLCTYKITALGDSILRLSRGYSRNPRIPRIVMYEMLATKVPNTGYVRKRRALILQSLKKKSSLKEIEAYLQAESLAENSDTIKDDINGLRNIGLDIIEDNSAYLLKDDIVGLSIPRNEESKSDITILKDTVRSKLTYVDHGYLVLIDLAYSDASNKRTKNSDAREFEILTANLFTQEMGFKGERLGDADRPDVLVWLNNFGVIIDNKSYKDGFSVGRHNEDEMSRYIGQAQARIPGQPSNEWWQLLSADMILYYLFVTSFLKGNYKKNLDSLKTLRKVDGGAISVDNLLYMAEKIRRGNLLEENIPTLFQNGEIIITI